MMAAPVLLLLLVSQTTEILGDKHTTEDTCGEGSTVGKVLLQSTASKNTVIQGLDDEGELTPGLVPLKLLWNSARKDYFAEARATGIQGAKDAGYKESTRLCYVFNYKAEGTVPLELYWNGGRQDNYVTAAGAGVAGGYGNFGIVGYIYPSYVRNDLIPLKTFWNGDNEDNMLHWARQSYYKEIRTEGYCFKKAPTSAPSKGELPPGLVPLKAFWNSARKDYYAEARATGIQGAKDVGYKESTRFPLCYVFDYKAEGTVPLELYWNGGKQDNYVTAAGAGAAGGYGNFGIVGYIYPNRGAAPSGVRNDLRPLANLWSEDRQDNMLHTFSRRSGYKMTRIEGYCFK